jgi:hypothetical protein
MYFLTDVLAAIIFGTIWLMLCMVPGKSIRRRKAASSSFDAPPPRIAPLKSRRRRSAYWIKLATEAVALQFGIPR